MRYLLIALLLACASASGQNINEQPLFGDQPKSQAAAETDRQFIESASKAAGSREAAARLETMRAWVQLKQGDAEVAIQGFNQAYLLDPNNAEVYWGLGVAMTQQGKFDLAVRMFGRALALDPQNPRLLADVGLSHARAAVGTSQDPIEQAKRLQGALPWFDNAEKLAPNYPQTYANRAVALYLLGNYTEAWVNVEKAEALDRASVDPKLLADLSKKLPRPGSAVATTVPDTTEVKTEAIAAQPVVQTEALPQSEVKKDVTPNVPQGSQLEPAPEAKNVAVSAEEASDKPAPKKKKLRVISAEPVRATGPDKRKCLDLPTNDAIMRCVYPRK